MRPNESIKQEQVTDFCAEYHIKTRPATGYVLRTHNKAYWVNVY